MVKYIFFFMIPLASLFSEMNVLAISGSTREGSYNKLLLKEATGILRQWGANVTFFDFKASPLPFYDGDLESQQGLPPNVEELRRLMIQSDVILIATPEYNSSIPGLLKNALDWTSRKKQGETIREAYVGKKFLLLSASPGKRGGARAVLHLKTVIEDIGGNVLPLTFSLPAASQAFDEQGHLKDPQQAQVLEETLRQVKG